MIDQYLYSDWITPPKGASGEYSLDSLISQISPLLNRTDSDSAMALFLLSPRIVSVMIDYKIEMSNKMGTGDIDINPAISLLKSIYSYAPNVNSKLSEFSASLSPEARQFISSYKPDSYSWKASEPAVIKDLAKRIEHEYNPNLIVGSAHGAIRPAALLSLYLGSELYFLRYSKFKKCDSDVHMNDSDRLYLSRFKNERVLAFDEDVASGTTLKRLKERLAPMFLYLRTASSISYVAPQFSPDYTGRIFC
jgi:hypothetical protein